MKKSYKSSSAEQLEAESVIFNMVKERMGIELLHNPQLYLADSVYTYMKPDFYSEEKKIVGEIFVHIGKPKKAQDNKIANDILKMLLLEKKKDCIFRKMIVVCDEEEERQLKGHSVLAESIRQFNIEIMRMDLPDELRKKVMAAQTRQAMTNI